MNNCPGITAKNAEVNAKLAKKILLDL